MFALISEVPFCLAFSEVYVGEKTIAFCGINMIFTLLLCFCILLAMDYIKNDFLQIFVIAGLFVLSLFSDWALVAPLFTILFARAGGDKQRIRNAYLIGAGLFALMNFSPGADLTETLLGFIYALLSAVGILGAGVVIVRLYNGKRLECGKTFSKWFFYWFYPVHLMMLGIIRILF